MTNPTGQRPHSSTLGIVALVFSCLIFLPLLPFIGLILGIIALVRTPPQASKVIPIVAICVGGFGGFLMQGILAAVAIPAFTKYIRRSKTVEASMNVRRLVDGMISYQMTEGSPPLQESDWTPKGVACEQPGHRFAPDPAAWQQPPWKDLAFSMDYPHYYQYRVRTSGSGKDATFYLEARGDLDCDGEFSLFQRTLRDGQSVGGLTVDKEME